MHFLFWTVGFIGLIISGIASAVLFFGTPKDTNGYAVTAGNNFKKEEHALEIRRRLSKIGFALFALGFILQIIAALGQIPTN